MPPSVITNENPPPNQGDFIIIRRAPASPSENHVELLMVWDVVYDQQEAIVQVMDPGQIISYLPTEIFVAAGSGRKIKNAPSAEAAVAVFRRAIDLELRHPSNAGRLWQVHPLVAVTGRDSRCFIRPSVEAVRKVLLGDRCPNEVCRQGMVAAAHRVQLYQQYLLPVANPRENRGQMPVQCPVCLPRDVVVKNEEQIPMVLHLDPKYLMSNDEFQKLRSSNKELNARRLEAGYNAIQTYPDFRFVGSSGDGESGVPNRVTAHPGRWVANIHALKQVAEATPAVESQPLPGEPVYRTNDNSGPRGEASPQAATGNPSRRIPSLRQIFGESLSR